MRILFTISIFVWLWAAWMAGRAYQARTDLHAVQEKVEEHQRAMDRELERMSTALLQVDRNADECVALMEEVLRR